MKNITYNENTLKNRTEFLFEQNAANIDFALNYIDKGWFIIPIQPIRNGFCSCDKIDCHSPGKHPIGHLTFHGLKDATTDETTIRSWWTKYPDANIGVITGEKSGIVVLDVDPKNGGNESFIELIEKYGDLPQTVTADTGGGGQHYVFRYPGKHVPNSSSKLGAGLDVKGDGGYIVVAPSIHFSGNRYQWREQTEVAQLPEILLDLMLVDKYQPLPANSTVTTPTTANSSPYGRGALQDEAQRVLMAVKGTRNDTLNKASFNLGQLVAAGALTESEVTEILYRAAVGAGLLPAEVQQTLRSGLTAGIRAPRQNQFASLQQVNSANRSGNEFKDKEQSKESSKSENGQTKSRVTILSCGLAFEVIPVERGKVNLTARSDSTILHQDVLSLKKAEDRDKFIKKLDLNNSGQKEAQQALLKLGDELEKAPVINTAKEEVDVKKVIFAPLSDGRLIEQIAGGKFAVYDSQDGSVGYESEIEADGVIYRPLDDDFLLKGGVALPEKLTEYVDDKTLDAEIEEVLKRYCDIPTRQLQLSARYARLTYIGDKIDEISYIRATGERGSGKSRYISTVGKLCLRPIVVVNPSAASLYRMMDSYRPTLIIDECNFETGSEDTSALIQILNSGFQRASVVPRMEKGVDGQFTCKAYSAFGPKLIGSLKPSDSTAFESRCIPVALQKTSNKEIPFRTSRRMLLDFGALREKLYLWRLRNWHRDFEQCLDDAEHELKGYQIEPRFIQIAIPLYALIDDKNLKGEFARMLETRTEDAAEERKVSFDGQLVSIIHGLLFDIEGERAEAKATWRSEDLFEPIEGEPLENATIEAITETFNAGLPEKKKYDSRWIGKQLSKLGFKRREIFSRKSSKRKKTAVVFERQIFTTIFGSYILPLPSSFSADRPDQQANSNNSNALSWSEEENLQKLTSFFADQSNQLQEQELLERSEVTGREMPETATVEDWEEF